MQQKITQDEFERYERVRRLGVVNMFDVVKVGQLSGLSRSTIIEIMKDYSRLKDHYSIVSEYDEVYSKKETQ